MKHDVSDLFEVKSLKNWFLKKKSKFIGVKFENHNRKQQL